jgi:hypothetical protein
VYEVVLSPARALDPKAAYSRPNDQNEHDSLATCIRVRFVENISLALLENSPMPVASCVR